MNDKSRQATKKVLERAFGYPYPVPEACYVFRPDGKGGNDGDGGDESHGGHWEYMDHAQSEALTEGRTPVIACGSNQSPEQLLRKYGTEDHMLPVTRAKVHDYDSVYSSHLTTYGSLPATLYPSTGTIVHISVTWLDEAQLEKMHATEPPDSFTHLKDIWVELADGRTFEHMHAYVTTWGPLMHSGAPIALKEIKAEKRRFPAMTQREVLAVVKDLLEVEGSLEAFITATVSDQALRTKWSRALQDMSQED